MRHALPSLMQPSLVRVRLHCEAAIAESRSKACPCCVCAKQAGRCDLRFEPLRSRSSAISSATLTSSFIMRTEMYSSGGQTVDQVHGQLRTMHTGRPDK